MEHIIRSFGAVRPNPYYITDDRSINDFCIIESAAGDPFISFVGVKTPGLTCADELGRHAADAVAKAGAFVLRNTETEAGAKAGVKTGANAGASETRTSETETCAKAGAKTWASETRTSETGTCAKAGVKTGASETRISETGTCAETAAVSTEFISRRLPPVRLSELTYEEREKLVREKPEYGRIICRCRGISEGEILDAIRRIPGAVTLDGVKRRTGAGSGRCQGGFCGQRITEILSPVALVTPAPRNVDERACRGDRPRSPAYNGHRNVD